MPRPILFGTFVILADLLYSLVFGVGTGLDPSWSNGITRAAELHLVFGRAIVFTYGPLGFLANGARLPGSFRCIVVAHAVISAILSAAVVYYCAKLSWRRFILTIGAISITSFLVRQYQSTASIEAIAVLSMLLLDRRTKNQTYEAIVIGIFAGLATLTKFTLGVQFAATAGLLLLIHAYGDLRGGATLQRSTRSLLAFVISSVVTISAVLDASLTSPILSFALWCLCIASGCFAISYRTSEKRPMIFAISLMITSIIALIAIGDLRDFIETSLEISSGYSSAMNIVASSDPAAELMFGIGIQLLLVTVALSQRSNLSSGAICCIAIFGWLNFKEGYVREGPGHIIAFLIPMVMTFAILLKTATSRLNLGLTTLAFSAVFFCFSAKVSANSSIRNFYTLANLMAPDTEFFEAFTLQASQSDAPSGLNSDRLDDAAVKRLKSHPIDVQPWESSVVFANDLQWNPEPIFQSVSAYTPVLDKLNANALALRNRYVLFDFAAIDGRNVMAESPLARRELVCNYRLDAQFGMRLATVRGGEQFVVLSPARFDRCNSVSKKDVKLSWDTPYALPLRSGTSLTFLALHMPMSPYGTLADILFHGPEVTLDVRDTTGQVTTTRLLPKNVVNGFLISPNLHSTSGFAAMLDGDLRGTPKSFSVHTNSPEMFSSDLYATMEDVSYKPIGVETCRNRRTCLRVE